MAVEMLESISVCAFKKCRISVPIDGSGDAGINIRGLEGYIVRNVDTDLESEEENMFELDSSNDESLTA